MSDYTLCVPHLVDVELHQGADLAVVYEALVGLGDEGMDLPPVYQDRPDDLQRRLVGWGWGIRPIVGNTRQLGIWGDYTALEQDRILLPALAPFLVDGCRYIFTRRDGWGSDFEGWSFDDGTARLRKAERYIEFDWAER